MENMISFTNTQFGEIRTVIRDGEPWFVAVDVCRALEIEDTGKAVQRLFAGDGTRIEIDHPQNPEKRLEVYAVSEPGLYSLVIRSRKPEARAFEYWITHEVLPAIRKHGIYATDDVIGHIIDNPDLGIRLLSRLKDEREQRHKVEAKIAQQEMLLLETLPKAVYLDQILQNKDLIPITIIAKDYGMSGCAMNKLLCSLGVQYRCKGQWVLNQRYAAHEYAHSMLEKVNPSKEVTYTCWTQKGRHFLCNLLKDRCGLLPIVERGTGHE